MESASTHSHALEYVDRLFKRDLVHSHVLGKVETLAFSRFPIIQCDTSLMWSIRGICPSLQHEIFGRATKWPAKCTIFSRRFGL